MLPTLRGLLARGADYGRRSWPCRSSSCGGRFPDWLPLTRLPQRLRPHFTACLRGMRAITPLWGSSRYHSRGIPLRKQLRTSVGPAWNVVVTAHFVEVCCLCLKIAAHAPTQVQVLRGLRRTVAGYCCSILLKNIAMPLQRNCQHFLVRNRERLI